MTKAEIFKYLDRIKELANSDNEGAHELEAELRVNFIKFVADPVSQGDLLLHEKAQLVLSSSQIEFDRWFA